MKQTTIYQVNVEGDAADYDFNQLFLQLPTRNELIEAIKDRIGTLTNEIHDAEDDYAEDGEDDPKVEVVEDMHLLLDVVRQGDLNEPLAVEEHAVVVAGRSLGAITVEPITVYGRDPNRVLEELIA